MRGSGIVTICPKERGARVMTFVVTRGTDCEPQVDRVERIRSDFPSVRFVTVVSGDSKTETKNLAIARRWRQPVAVDTDGSVVNLYGVGVCPITVFARNGRVRDHEHRKPHGGAAAGQDAEAARVTEPELELNLVDGWVEPELGQEFPELSLLHTRLDVRPTRSPPEVRHRLRMLADRYTGGKVVHMHQDPVPWAYRVFSRQVGIDPDHDRTPVEAVALRRLKQGGLHSENLVDDALTIAIAETGVPLIALDAERVEGEARAAARA